MIALEGFVCLGFIFLLILVGRSADMIANRLDRIIKLLEKK